MSITADNHPRDLSWSIFDTSTFSLHDSSSGDNIRLVSQCIDLNPSTCYGMSLNDGRSDGLGGGSLELAWNGELLWRDDTNFGSVTGHFISLEEDVCDPAFGSDILVPSLVPL